MNIRRLDQIVAFLLTGFGIYLVWAGLQYGFMQGTTPGTGFFPALMGGAIALLSLVNLIRSLINLEKLKSDMGLRDIVKFCGIVVAMLVFVLVTPWLGMTVAAMALMIAVSFIIKPSRERKYLLRLATIAVIVPIVCNLLFGHLLSVPIPTGIFGF